MCKIIPPGVSGAAYPNPLPKIQFKILKEDSGTFKFELGLSREEMETPKIADFMYLLMEGLNRMDEESIKTGFF